MQVICLDDKRVLGVVHADGQLVQLHNHPVAVFVQLEKAFGEPGAQMGVAHDISELVQIGQLYSQLIEPVSVRQRVRHERRAELGA